MSYRRGVNMDSEALLADAVKRRWWLLSKALESASFEDALKLARAADEFLASGGDAAVLGLPELCPRCAASNLAGEPAGKPAELEKQPERLPEKQREIVVVSEGNGKYLVNGRFSEGLDALVMRANRLRERQQKPLFQLIPSV